MKEHGSEWKYVVIQEKKEPKDSVLFFKLSLLNFIIKFSGHF